MLSAIVMLVLSGGEVASPVWWAFGGLFSVTYAWGLSVAVRSAHDVELIGIARVRRHSVLRTSEIALADGRAIRRGGWRSFGLPSSSARTAAPSPPPPRSRGSARRRQRSAGAPHVDGSPDVARL